MAEFGIVAKAGPLLGGQPAGTLSMTDHDGAEVEVTAAPLEELRQLTDRLDTASSGLVVLLELARRMETAPDLAGRRPRISRRDGNRQSLPLPPASAPI